MSETFLNEFEWSETNSNGLKYFKWSEQLKWIEIVWNGPELYLEVENERHQQKKTKRRSNRGRVVYDIYGYFWILIVTTSNHFGLEFQSNFFIFDHCDKSICWNLKKNGLLSSYSAVPTTISLLPWRNNLLALLLP